MTPEQSAILAIQLRAIRYEIQSIANTDIPDTTDEYEANQAIADLRIKLANVDMQLFSLYRLLNNFVPNPVRERHTPTIDDLEI